MCHNSAARGTAELARCYANHIKWVPKAAIEDDNLEALATASQLVSCYGLSHPLTSRAVRELQPTTARVALGMVKPIDALCYRLDTISDRIGASAPRHLYRVYILGMILTFTCPSRAHHRYIMRDNDCRRQRQKQCLVASIACMPFAMGNGSLIVEQVVCPRPSGTAEASAGSLLNTLCGPASLGRGRGKGPNIIYAYTDSHVSCHGARSVR